MADAAPSAERAGTDAIGALQVVREVETGAALADYWRVEPVEYRATAEAVLNSAGANYISRNSVAASALTDFLVLFGGGGGAPHDLVKLRTESATVQQGIDVK